MNSEHPAGYIAGAPAGTYDHRAMPCAACEVTCAFFRKYKSQEAWRCTRCGGSAIEGSPDHASAPPALVVEPPSSAEQSASHRAHAGDGGFSLACSTCRWWVSPFRTEGQCRRKAPPGFRDNGARVWPITADDDFCGEHEAAR